MSIQKKHILLPIVLLILFNTFAQDPLRTVIAKNGDGVFSLLRNEGIEIVKYYSEFIELNKTKIVNGSHLIIGEEYRIPHAPDSFKNMGLDIEFPNGKEIPIFDGELASLKKKDSSLQNTVYYLIADSRNKNKEGMKNTNNDILIGMARKLLQHSARVYLLGNTLNASLDLIELANLINKRYLKHKGTYQRVLIIKTDNSKVGSRTDATVYHYAASKEGKKMADNILGIFDKNSVKHRSIEEYSTVFTDFKNISFAKNILPAITFVEMGTNIPNNKKTLKISSNKKNITDLITNGILSDYSRVEFEDN